MTRSLVQSLPVLLCALGALAWGFAFAYGLGVLARMPWPWP